MYRLYGTLVLSIVVNGNMGGPPGCHHRPKSIVQCPVEQGHVRVGTETITQPAYLVTRAMEDFVTWVDTSKIKRKVLKYNDALDDYDLLN